jgi:hypothetical protein
MNIKTSIRVCVDKKIIIAVYLNMFSSPKSSYDADLFHVFFCEPPQVPPDVLAVRIPGHKMHLKALASGLRHVRSSIGYIVHMLNSGEEWSMDVQDTVARELSSATMFLSGILDGLLLLELMKSDTYGDHTRVDFQHTRFSTSLLRDEQLGALSKRSPSMPHIDDNTTHEQCFYVDFWSVANFWKHYFPYQPKPSWFDRQRVCDICIHFGGTGVSIIDGKARRDCQKNSSMSRNHAPSEKSGPILRDLIIPVFNHACRIVHILATMVGAEDDIRIDEFQI